MARMEMAARARPRGRAGPAAIMVMVVAGVGATSLAYASGGEAASAPGAWVSVPQPEVSRSGDHTATALADGRVLVVGGATCGSLCHFHDAASRSAELYDPVARRWQRTGSTVYPRQYHTATLLADGRVLVAGGAADAGGGRTGWFGGALPDFGQFSATAEIYSPATGLWTATGAMHHPRVGHTATLLPGGRVLVAGGASDEVPAGSSCPPACPSLWESSAELFDPSTGAWTETGPMQAVRGDHTATLLRDGTVLVVGGRDGVGSGIAPGGIFLTTAEKTAEVYDPTVGSWTLVPRLMRVGRVNHTATQLPDGTVLIIGGADGYFHGGMGHPVDATELYDPAVRRFISLARLPQPRFGHSATLLTDRRVLVLGGILDRDSVRIPQAHRQALPELFDPHGDTWAPAPLLPADPSTHAQRRDIELRLTGGHTATRLRDGTVLVVGGDDNSRSAQLFDPAGGAGPGLSGSSSSSGAVIVLVVMALGVVVAAGVVIARPRWRRGRLRRGPAAGR